MTVKTSQDYIERLKNMRKNVYLKGERISRLDERLLPGINTICLTFDMAHNPEFKDLLTTTSHITGEKINRFCHICQSHEDLLKKQSMIRLLCYYTGGCIQRCMTKDALNALSVATKLVDIKYGTDYYDRFLKYLEHFQANDLVAACAQTDVKGDRIKRPKEQRDPDLYLHVIKKDDKGIVVRGAKAHVSIAPHADEIIVFPTRALTEGENDWAVAFAIPADAEGLKIVARPHQRTQRIKLDAPIAKYGDISSIVIFDDTFIPWERVFLCGEVEFGRIYALLFALFHRHSYTGCKPALSDVLCGFAALISECNNIEGASHVREKLSEYVCLSELVYAAGVASAYFSTKAPPGTCVPDIGFVNVGRKLAGEHIYREFEILADLAGGLACTLPLEEDFCEAEMGPLLHKYIMRNPELSAEYVHRAFRAVEDILASDMTGLSQIGGLHGGGSPVMEMLMIMATYDVQKLKEIAKYLAGINKKLPRIERKDLIRPFW
ncbi:MAG: 4-hydroxyphenylacetate 3-hydroxylase N-terminal domain-containing protein [Candidatus Bathyarchaeia archaeon]